MRRTRRETLVEDLGVFRSVVDLASARATVINDPTTHGVDDLCAAVVAAGYVARPAHDAMANRPPEWAVTTRTGVVHATPSRRQWY